MKIIVLSVLLLCRLVSARAEEEWGVTYTLPEQRPLLQKLIPTFQDIPDRYYGFQREWIFRGCEFKPSIWGQGRNAESITVYWAEWKPLFGKPRYRLGEEGEIWFGLALIAKNSCGNNGWFPNSVGPYVIVGRTF